MAAGKPMNLDDMVQQLVKEREMLDQTISSLIRLKETRGGRRGRPPVWLERARQMAGEAKGRRSAPVLHPRAGA